MSWAIKNFITLNLRVNLLSLGSFFFFCLRRYYLHFKKNNNCWQRLFEQFLRILDLTVCFKMQTICFFIFLVVNLEANHILLVVFSVNQMQVKVIFIILGSRGIYEVIHMSICSLNIVRRVIKVLIKSRNHWHCFWYLVLELLFKRTHVYAECFSYYW